MGYQHLTTFERGRIEALNQLGYAVRQIGKKIVMHNKTVSRDLARNSRNKYCFERVQKAYVQLRQ